MAQSSGGDELKEMRQMLEQQSRQLDVLASEIARLNLLLEDRNNGGPAPAGGLAAANAEAPKAVPAAQAVQAAQAAQAAQDEPAPGGPVHIVAKGETLTAIAKRYKVTVPELLKVNKIADVRKLQIGQTLVLPPGAKLPESPTPTPQH
jgi:LysM repeat protein